MYAWNILEGKFTIVQAVLCCDAFTSKNGIQV